MPQVVANNIRAVYDVSGKGPDVVFVHGWMASRRYWHEAARRLPGFRIWAPDLFGFGDSEKPSTGYSLDNYAAYLLGFLDAIGVDRAAVIGHSMGASVVAYTALKSPSRFKALGLVDAALAGIAKHLPEWSAEPVMKMLMRFADPGENYRHPTVRNPFGLGERESEIVFEEARKADLLGAAACGKMMSRPTDWSRLSKLSVPTLVIYGGEDFLLGRGMDRDIMAFLPHSEFKRLPNCGHLPMLENPAAFYTALLHFLERIPRR